MKICIYGASSKKISDDYINAVETLGKKLALRGHSLVFGGGASGLMGAAARGLLMPAEAVAVAVPRCFVHIIFVSLKKEI